jgi:hypothetical protein
MGSGLHVWRLWSQGYHRYYEVTFSRVARPLPPFF